MSKRKVATFDKLSLSALQDCAREGSPLACALISSAFLENALGCLLDAVMIEREEKEGEEKEGEEKEGKDTHWIIANAGANQRANYCYYFGLIDETTFKNSCMIFSIRNRFAHSHSLIDFSDPKVKQLCGELKTPTLFKNGEQLSLKEHDKFYDDHRAKFSAVVLTTFLAIVSAVHTSNRNQPLPAFQNCWIDDKESFVIPQIWNGQFKVQFADD